METSAEIIEIAKALCTFQGDLQGVDKEGFNPHFKSRYITLDSIWKAIRLPLLMNGLTVLQDVTSQGDNVSVETRVLHTSGQWIKFGPLVMPLGKKDPQSIGSCTSYARRYSICSALGVVADIDDDGQVAQDSHKVQPSKQTQTQTPLVTKEQVVELNEILKWLDPSVTNKILSAYGISSIEQMSSLSFAPIMTRLKAMFDEKKVES